MIVLKSKVSMGTTILLKFEQSGLTMSIKKNISSVLCGFTGRFVYTLEEDYFLKIFLKFMMFLTREKSRYTYMYINLKLQF